MTIYASAWKNQSAALAMAVTFAACASSSPHHQQQGREEIRGPLVLPPGPIVADHHAADAFETIPQEAVRRAGSTLSVYFGHTSHGSQITTGLALLAVGPFAVNVGGATLSYTEIEGDLGQGGDLSWIVPTREALNRSDSDFNIVVWSWCGGASDASEQGIASYLHAMDGLRQEFPGVAFVYMTGHTDGTGPDGNLRGRNDQIRDHVRSTGGYLFDFADIETFDPAGQSHPDATDGCLWCPAWCAAHPEDCPRCGECAHSHCLNCLRKGQAFWWLLARIAGWVP